MLPIIPSIMLSTNKAPIVRNELIHRLNKNTPKSESSPSLIKTKSVDSSPCRLTEYRWAQNKNGIVISPLNKLNHSKVEEVKKNKDNIELSNKHPIVTEECIKRDNDELTPWSRCSIGTMNSPEWPL